MRLYVAAVCSIMIYGSEAWRLTDEVKRAINGANSKMVSTITGRTIQEEAAKNGKTYDAVAGIRATRLRWLGHILRMKKTKGGEERMIKKAVKHLYHNRAEGDILMDAPNSASWEELTKMAENRQRWQTGVRAIKDTVNIYAKKRGGGRNKKKGKKGGKRYEMVGAGADAFLVLVHDNEGSGEASEEERKNEGGASERATRPRSKPSGRARRKPRGRVRCNDGFAMSVQASAEHACTPRNDVGPYAAVEIGYPNELEDALLPYSGQMMICGHMPTIYTNVPAKTLKEVVAKHGGLRRDSERLPDLVETDEDGCQWAAAAQLPSTEEETDSESDEQAPPPPLPTTPHPAPAPARTGALTPPTTLTNAELSPIQEAKE